MHTYTVEDDNDQEDRVPSVAGAAANSAGRESRDRDKGHVKDSSRRVAEVAERGSGFGRYVVEL